MASSSSSSGQRFKSTPGKKLALIEPDILKRLVSLTRAPLPSRGPFHSDHRQRQQQQQQDSEDEDEEEEEGGIVKRRMKALGRDMARLLQNPGRRVDPDTRRARYNMALTNYRRLARKVDPRTNDASLASSSPRSGGDDVAGTRSPPARWEWSSEEEDEGTEESEDEDYETPDEDQEEVMMRKLDKAVPKTVRPRAKALLKLISASDGAVSWDPNTMELTLRGDKVAGSNVLDLAVYAARDRKPMKRGRARSRPPPGFKEFAGALRTVNAPRELVRNKRRWTDIYGAGEGEEPEEEKRRSRTTPRKPGKSREYLPSSARRAEDKSRLSPGSTPIPWLSL